MKCVKCGEDVAEDAAFCAYCGEPLGERGRRGAEGRIRNCVSCGRTIEWDVNACPYCGHSYIAQMRLSTGRARVRPDAETRNCVECGRSIDWDVNVCQHCGHDYREPGDRRAGGKRTPYPTIGGVFTLGTGVISLLAAFLVFDWLVGGRIYEEELYLITAWVASSSFAIFGGILALMRKAASLAITGAVFALIAGFFFFFVGIIGGIIGVIFISISHKEFR